MKSFSILRTHTGLSTNVKVIVDSNYNLYLESIGSAPELDADRFKKVQFNKSNFYDELVPYFFKDFPVDLAFSIKYDNDNSNMSVDFQNQYDDLYLGGARNILDNKNYSEEYEYFAPLYVFKHHLPKFFIIFRVDGPGLVNLSKDNFRSEFLENFKTVKLFDLTKNTSLGEWMYNNFSNNPSFPVTGLEVDFKELEFSKWIGIDYESGGYTYKPLFLDENLENENNLFDFDKLFLDGYRVNKVIHPHIINFSFLFDDTPASPTSLRKWSINRYCGFYLEDLELIDSITPFVLPQLRDDVVVYSGNIITSTSFGDPFSKGYRDDVDMWIEYLGEFYKVVKFTETLELSVTPQTSGTNTNKVVIDTVSNPQITKYRIISEEDLSGKQNILNKRSCYINSQNQVVRVSDGSAYTIKNFTFGDVNLIEIDGRYHNLILKNGFLTVVTDFGFNFSENNSFEYFINSAQSGFTTKMNLLITNQNPPKNFKIWRAKFTDIKDFDTFIIDTEFSKFEYEKRNDLTKTEETKMFLTDLRSQSSPQNFDDFTFKGKTELVPVASDYTANLETFRIEEGRLTDLWRKNPIYCRWGYQNSLSAHDYPYLLNNNDVHENFNRTVDTQNSKPDRSSRNLDYFYTLNSGTTSYLHHSLHIEKNYGNVQDGSFRFELDKYLELGSFSQKGLAYTFTFSYFDLLFSPTQSFLDGELLMNKKKYSYFEQGDNVIPNTTLFRGLKFRLFEVDNIKYNTTSIENINLVPSNFFSDYKFSVLLSSNDYMVGDDDKLYKPYFWDYFNGVRNNTGFAKLITSTNSVGLNPDLDSRFVTSGTFGRIPKDLQDLIVLSNTFSFTVNQTNNILEVDCFYPNNFPNLGMSSSYVINIGNDGLTLDKNFNTSSSTFQSGIWRDKMQWKVISRWELDRSYSAGDLVVWNDIFYRVTNETTVSNPELNPSNMTSSYALLKYNNGLPINSTIIENFPFTWLPVMSPLSSYGTSSWVYRFGEYYQFNSGTAVDFWNPTQSYSENQIVIQDNKYFISVTFSQHKVPVGLRPLAENRKEQSASRFQYWKETSEPDKSQLKWNKVQLWDRNTTYLIDTLIVHDGILYRSNSSTTLDDVPGISSKWERKYSFVPDTGYKYSSFNNPFIEINDSYYYCEYNPGQTNWRANVFLPTPGELTLAQLLPFSGYLDGNLTLDSGITIYINKKWKNVLVNITINDNTIDSDKLIMDETKNLERDSLYLETNGRLTAANFIRQINDLDTLYGFADYTSYVVIEEDGSFKKFNFKKDLDQLKYLIICEEPDELKLKNNSLSYKLSTVDKNVLKSSRYLSNGTIDNLEKIDFYNDLPLGVEIQNIKSDSKILKNYNNQKSEIFQTIFRHTGNYMPIFYEIELFKPVDLYETGKICEIQFVLNVTSETVNCPILVWSNRIQVESDIHEVKVPLYHTSTFNGTHSYMGQFFTQSLFLQFNNNVWNLTNNINPTVGIIATSSNLIGTYSSFPLESNIQCGTDEGIFCITYLPTSTNLPLTLPVLPTYNESEELIYYYISGSSSVLWNQDSFGGIGAWQFDLVDQLGDLCTALILGTQSNLPIGVNETDCGLITISPIQNCLGSWLPEGVLFQNGQISISVQLSLGTLNINENITVLGAASNTLQAWTDFYNQIISVFRKNELLLEKTFSFQVYEPGNSNIAPTIEPGYYVLSIQYDSEVCDLKASSLNLSTNIYCLSIRLTDLNYQPPVGRGLGLFTFTTLLVQLRPDVLINGFPSYFASFIWDVNPQLYVFQLRFGTNSQWELVRLDSGSEVLIASSPSIEGIYDVVFPANLVSISDGECQSYCVEIMFMDGSNLVTTRGTFLRVNQLFNGRQFYSGYLLPVLGGNNRMQHQIRWSNGTQPGWYLVNPADNFTGTYSFNTLNPDEPSTIGWSSLISGLTFSISEGFCNITQEDLM